MKRLILCAALFSLSTLLLNCNKDNDPAPDFTSAKISFLYELSDSPSYEFYVVIADTTGNVLTWKKIDLGIKNEFDYPPDPKLVTLTLITRYSSGDLSSTRITTFTGVPADDYVFEEPMHTDKPEDDGKVKLSVVNNQVDFNYLPQYMSGNFEALEVSNSENISTYEYGVYDNELNNLFLWGQAKGVGDIKYLYKEDVNDGDSIGISLATFQNEFTKMPTHAANYPSHADMESTYLSVTGVTETSGNYTISSATWLPSASPVLAYADIDGLFPTYRTEMYSADGMYSNYQRNIAATPNMNFSNLNTAVTGIEMISTKRIAVDLAGEGEFVFTEGVFGASGNIIFYNVYLPFSTKIRMKLPLFTKEIVDQIPPLSYIEDKPVTDLYIDEYKMSYKELFTAWIDNGFSAYIPNMRSRGFDADIFARKSVDITRMKRRFEQKSIFDGKQN